MKTLMIGLSACGIAGVAQAQTPSSGWLSLGGTDDSMMAVDTSRIRTIGTKKRVWGALVYIEPQNGISYLIGYQEIDCLEETIRTLQAAAYDLDNERIADEGAGAPIYITPGTLNDSTRAYLCEGVIDDGDVIFDTFDDFRGWVRSLDLPED